jgi:hypothetical protein
MPALETGYKKNFETLRRAIRNGDCALVDCRDKRTGQPVRVVCAMQRESDGEITMVPIAKLFDGDPYEELDPPGYDL